MPWAEMFRAALLRGLPPDAFWKLSLKEWLWLSDGGDANGLNRPGLQKLIEAYPDLRTKEKQDG